jgi:hypothetical protein
MMHPHSTIYYSKLYRDFMAIDQEAYRAKVYFFELHEKAIGNLSLEEYLEILIIYTDALFEADEFVKHTLMAEVAIETSLYHNVPTINERDIVQYMLHKKAYSHALLGQFDTAKDVAKELLRFQPDATASQNLLKEIYTMQEPRYLSNLKALSVACSLLAMLLAVISELWIQALYPQYYKWLLYTQSTLVLGGFLILGVGYTQHLLKAKKQMQRVVKEIKSLKSRHHQH